MPKPYKTKRKPRRKPYTRKRKSYRRSKHTQLVFRPMKGPSTPFPPTLFTTMTYSKTFNFLQSISGTPDTVVFRANGPYDPEVVLSGGQPRYYDTLLGPEGGTAPYTQYRVHSSKIVATIWPFSANANQGNCLLSIMPRRSTHTSVSSLQEMTERAYSRTMSMTTVGSYKPRKLSSYCKIKTILGHKDLMDVDASAARYNTVPAEEVYWDISLCDVQGAVPAEITVQLTITYFLQLYSLADVH